MQVYLNVIHVNKGENEVVLLDNLNKQQILDRLEDFCKNQDLESTETFLSSTLYSLTVASSTYKESDKESASELITLTEYLEKENIVVDEKAFYLLAVRVTKEFIKEYGIKPRRVNRQSPKTGKYNNKAYAYTDEQTKVIDRVLTGIPHVKNPRK